MKILTHVSASQITTFQHPGGCNRKWWFNKIAGLPVPQHPSAALGEKVHGTIEAYLKADMDEPSLLHPIAQPAAHTLRLLRTRKAGGSSIEVEAKMERRLRNGLTFVGRIDLLVFPQHEDPLVVDHKTSSSEEWALDEQQLQNDLQMNAYAYEVLARAPTGHRPSYVRVAHNFMRTKNGAYHRYTETPILATNVLDNWRKLQDITDEMREVARIEDPAHVAENRRACDKYGGCAFKSNCQSLWAARGERSASPYAALGNDPTPAPTPVEKTMPAPTPASVLESMALGREVILAAVQKGSAVDDTPDKRYSAAGAAPAQPAAPAAPAKSNGAAINPPEAGTITRDPKVIAAIDAAVAKPQYVDGAGNKMDGPSGTAPPAVNMNDAMKLAVQLGWSKEEAENDLSDAVLVLIVQKNIKREDVLELVKGTGLVDGKEAEDVVVEVKLKPKERAARPSRGAAAPAAEQPKVEPTIWFYHPESSSYTRMKKSEWTGTGDSMALVEIGTDAEKAAHEKANAPAPKPATQGTAPDRQPRNAGPRLLALGYPQAVIDGMSKDEMRRILPKDGPEIPYEKPAAASSPELERFRTRDRAQAEQNGGMVPVTVDGAGQNLADILAEKDTEIAEAREERRLYGLRILELEEMAKAQQVRIKELALEALALKQQGFTTGLTLYVDCVPEGAAYTDLDVLLAPYCAKAAAEGYTDERTGKASGPVAYYDLMPYNNGQKKVIGYLLSDISKVQALPAIAVDSRSPLAARALEVLRPLAAAVVVGRSR